MIQTPAWFQRTGFSFFTVPTNSELPFWLIALLWNSHWGYWLVDPLVVRLQVDSANKNHILTKFNEWKDHWTVVQLAETKSEAWKGKEAVFVAKVTGSWEEILVDVLQKQKEQERTDFLFAENRIEKFMKTAVQTAAVKFEAMQRKRVCTALCLSPKCSSVSGTVSNVHFHTLLVMKIDLVFQGKPDSAARSICEAATEVTDATAATASITPEQQIPVNLFTESPCLFFSCWPCSLFVQLQIINFLASSWQATCFEELTMGRKGFVWAKSRVVDKNNWSYSCSCFAERRRRVCSANFWDQSRVGGQSNSWRLLWKPHPPLLYKRAERLIWDTMPSSSFVVVMVVVAIVVFGVIIVDSRSPLPEWTPWQKGASSTLISTIFWPSAHRQFHVPLFQMALVQREKKVQELQRKRQEDEEKLRKELENKEVSGNNMVSWKNRRHNFTRPVTTGTNATEHRKLTLMNKQEQQFSYV